MIKLIFQEHSEILNKSFLQKYNTYINNYGQAKLIIPYSRTELVAPFTIRDWKCETKYQA